VSAATGGFGLPAPTGIAPTDPYAEVEAALKALRESRDKEKQRQAADRLDRALRKLEKQFK
jgi:predicted outer membrane protein